MAINSKNFCHKFAGLGGAGGNVRECEGEKLGGSSGGARGSRRGVLHYTPRYILIAVFYKNRREPCHTCIRSKISMIFF